MVCIWYFIIYIFGCVLKSKNPPPKLILSTSNSSTKTWRCLRGPSFETHNFFSHSPLVSWSIKRSIHSWINCNKLNTHLKGICTISFNESCYGLIVAILMESTQSICGQPQPQTIFQFLFMLLMVKNSSTTGEDVEKTLTNNGINIHKLPRLPSLKRTFKGPENRPNLPQKETIIFQVQNCC